jgi:thioredoxin reductase (NADPH)
MLDCLVIGAGPAGLTAALYLRRFHRSIRVVSLPDSRALQIERTRNYPGFPDGISGTDLLQRLRQQLTAFDGEVIDGEVTALRTAGAGAGFTAEAGGERFVARTVLLATGVKDAVPACEDLHLLRERALLRQCPICDGHEHSARRIAVLGRGDHGAREALFLRHFSEHLVLLDCHAAEPVTPPERERLAHAGVGVMGAAVRVVSVDDHDGVRLLLEDGAALEVDVVYAALGARARTSLAQQLGAGLDAAGNVVTDAQLRSSVPGLYAAGDAVSALDQIAVAVGHGAIAATAIHNSLR